MMPGGSCDGAGSAPVASTSAAATGAATSTSVSKGGGGAGTSSSAAMKKGPWTAAEDAVLLEYVREHGEGNWNAVQRNTGLLRCGKSCRLRWSNHLRPNLKKGSFSPDEERLILQLHAQMGNKWARMAAQLPGRTDNEIKNYWNTRLKRRQRAGLPLYPPDIHRHAALHRPPTPTFDLKSQVSAPMGNTPLDVFERMSFSGTAGAAATTSTASNPLLLGHPHPPFLVQPLPAEAAGCHQSAKRPRLADVNFSLLFSTNPAPPPPPQVSLFQYNPLWNYDPGPLPPHPFPLQQQQSFCEKTELPSSQLYPVPPMVEGKGGLPLERSNNELLDALLCDPHQPVCCSRSSSGWGGHAGERHQTEFLMPELASHDVKWVKAAMGNAHVAGPSPSQPACTSEDLNLPIDFMVKTWPARKMGSMDDDIAALLDGIPIATVPMAAAAPTAAAPPPREWLASDSGEGSHGQSSAVTGEVELEMQHLASSLSMAADEDRSWSIGPCHWDSRPPPGCGIP